MTAVTQILTSIEQAADYIRQGCGSREPRYPETQSHLKPLLGRRQPLAEALVGHSGTFRGQDTAMRR